MAEISQPTNYIADFNLESYSYGNLSNKSIVKNVTRGQSFSNNISFSIGPAWATITEIRLTTRNELNDQVTLNGNYENLTINFNASGEFWTGWDDTYFYKDNSQNLTAPDIDLLPLGKLYYAVDQKTTFQINKEKIYKIEIDINPTAYDFNQTTFDSNTTTIRNESYWKPSDPFSIVTANVYIDQIVDNNFNDVTDFIANYY